MLLAYTRLFGWNQPKYKVLNPQPKTDRCSIDPSSLRESQTSKNTAQNIQQFQQVYYLERRLFL